MALMYTPQAELGSPCPSFSVNAVDGKTYGNADFASAPAKVFMFICNHCPYVQAIEDRIINLAHDLSPKGVQFVAICSNDAADYPEDSFDNIKSRWESKQYGFPYLYDDSQKMAKDFAAICTPDFFVYDGDDKLAYRGRLDDSWKDATKVSQQELRLAIEALLSNAQKLPEVQNPSMGCSIKWK